MVHTFQLSKMISKEMFDTTINSLKIRFYRNCWVTRDYVDKGFQLIHLYKFQRKDITAKKDDSDVTHHYMIALSINTANMFYLLQGKRA